MDQSPHPPSPRTLGLDYWTLPPGPRNAITDVAGVRVGHTTLIDGEGPLVRGQGPVRTGVTVVLPHNGNLFREKVRAAVHTINGFGKACGFEEVRELGLIESPIALTNTLNVWRVADALADYTLRHNPQIGVSTSSFNALVGECNDGYLNDIQGRHVNAQHVWAALEAASDGPVTQGCVGAGTGTSCFGWKGGIGTSSRVLDIPQQPNAAAPTHTFTVGCLVQSNFGRSEEMIFGGLHVGRHLQPPIASKLAPENDNGEKGSIMMVLATDAPLDSRQLQRLAVRAAAGLARTGSHIGHGSGDFVIAFSTAQRIHHWPDSLLATHSTLADEPRAMQWLLPAVVECVEEAVLNSLCAAHTMTGRDGHVRHALPLDQVAQLLQKRL
ncbi:MAG: P1 family peptidase [Caldilineaceae bacterium]